MAAAPMVLILALAAAGADANLRPWRANPVFRQTAARLDRVRAIDNHTHLLEKGQFDPRMDSRAPVGLRSSRSEYAEALGDRFGVTVERGNVAAAAARAIEVRSAMIARLGLQGYWMDHLDFTRTEIALVNQPFPEGTDGRRLRWVPHATNLLYPLPAEALMVRSPKHRDDITRVQSNLKRFLKEAGLGDVPPRSNSGMPTCVRSFSRTCRRHGRSRCTRKAERLRSRARTISPCRTSWRDASSSPQGSGSYPSTSIRRSAFRRSCERSSRTCAISIRSSPTCATSIRSSC